MILRREAREEGDDSSKKQQLLHFLTVLQGKNFENILKNAVPQHAKF